MNEFVFAPDLFTNPDQQQGYVEECQDALSDAGLSGPILGIISSGIFELRRLVVSPGRITTLSRFRGFQKKLKVWQTLELSSTSLMKLSQKRLNSSPSRTWLEYVDPKGETQGFDLPHVLFDVPWTLGLLTILAHPDQDMIILKESAAIDIVERPMENVDAIEHVKTLIGHLAVFGPTLFEGEDGVDVLWGPLAVLIPRDLSEWDRKLSAAICRGGRLAASTVGGIIGASLTPSAIFGSVIGAAAGGVLTRAFRPIDELTGTIELPFDELSLADGHKFAGPYPHETTPRLWVWQEASDYLRYNHILRNAWMARCEIWRTNLLKDE